MNHAAASYERVGVAPEVIMMAHAKQVVHYLARISDADRRAEAVRRLLVEIPSAVTAMTAPR